MKFDDEDLYRFKNPQDERDTISFIKKYLITPEQKKLLFDHNLEIADLLNGRTPGNLLETVKYPLYHDWNQKLGEKLFGGDCTDPYECFPESEKPVDILPKEITDDIAKLAEKIKKTQLGRHSLFKIHRAVAWGIQDKVEERMMEIDQKKVNPYKK